MIPFPFVKEAAEQKEKSKTYGIDFGVRESISTDEIFKEIKQMLIRLKIKGSLRKRGNGLLEFRSTVLGSVYGRSASEFEEKLLEKIKELQQGEKKPKSAILLSEFYQESYLPFKKENIKESSIGGVQNDYNFIVKSKFDKPLNRYTSEEIEKFLYSVPKTRKRQKLRGFLNNLFKYAKKLGKIKNNPCDNVEQMKHVSVNGRALSFEIQEVFFDRIFNNANLPLNKKLYLIFIYLTGARRAEALDAKLSDFDLKNNVLHLPGTKTDGSDRLLPLSPLIKKLFDCMTENGLAGETTFFGLRVNQLYGLMEKGAQGYHLHDLRHTFGTIQVCALKLDPKTVSMYMGHTDISMTLKTYTHPDQLDLKLFYDGSISEDEKPKLLRQQYNSVLNKISAFLDSCTQNLPKK